MHILPKPLIQPVDPRLTLQVDIRPMAEIEAWLADELNDLAVSASAGYTNEVTSMPELNVPLLAQAIRFAQGEPTLNTKGKPLVWDQTSWVVVDPVDPVCGTACCIAGWTAIAVGAELLPNSFSGGADYCERAVLPGRPVSTISDIAYEQLGLSLDERLRLFWPENTLSDITLLARLFAFARGLDPDDVCARYVPEGRWPDGGPRRVRVFYPIFDPLADAEAGSGAEG